MINVDSTYILINLGDNTDVLFCLSGTHPKTKLANGRMLLGLPDLVDFEVRDVSDEAVHR
jgi:hypothetical protein